MLTCVALPIDAWNTGWQHHPVCNTRFHFIIPSEATLEDPGHLVSLVEAKFRGNMPPDTPWAPPPDAQLQDAGGDTGPSPYVAAASVFESKDHLLHGLLHLNGYGHLLRMNGAQGGSRRLIGV